MVQCPLNIYHSLDWIMGASAQIQRMEAKEGQQAKGLKRTHSLTKKSIEDQTPESATR